MIIPPNKCIVELENIMHRNKEIIKYPQRFKGCNAVFSIKNIICFFAHIIKRKPFLISYFLTQDHVFNV